MAKKGILQEHSTAVAFAMRVLDLGAILLSAWIAQLLFAPDDDAQGRLLRAGVMALLIAFIVFDHAQVYRAWRGSKLTEELRTLIKAWALTFAVLAGVLLLTSHGGSDHYPRKWLVAWWCLGMGACVVMRVLLRLALRAIRASGRNTRTVVVAIANDFGRSVVERAQAAKWAGLRVMGYFDDRETARVEAIAGVECLGSLEGLAPYVEAHNIDQVWIALPFRAEDRMRYIVDALRHSTTDIRLLPDINGFNLLNHSIGEVIDLPVINLSSTPMVGINRLVKALEDRLLAALILLLISPLMLVIAAGIKLTSPGPVFFRQERLGYDGRPFRVWKFRSMKVHTEDGGQVTQATRTDPRITPFGAFLRRTSLDELPQFFNVLDGSMSIVGPRPHAVAHNEQFKDRVDRYMRRHKVKPGITGLAQVEGYRGETDTLEKMELRVKKDLEYIENWSLGLDLKIIFMTIFKGFVNRNAY